MKNLFLIRKIYLVTDSSSATGHSAAVKKAIDAGIKIIQLRDKTMSGKDLYKEACSVRDIALKKGAILIINDHTDLALAVNAHGVHLGQNDLPVSEARRILGRRKIIGVSTHTLKQAIKAQSEGADYIGFGPVFHTVTKKAGAPKGVKYISKIRKHIDIPIVGIGGIKPENIADVFSAGANAAAISSGILKGDIISNIRDYIAKTRLRQAISNSDM